MNLRMLSAAGSALSMAGLGMMVWLGISIALLQGRGTEMALLRSIQRDALLLALVLAVLAAPWLHAAAVARWRRASLAVLCVALAANVVLLVLLARQPVDPGWTAVAAALLGLAAIAALLLHGASLASTGAGGWRAQMVPPNRLAQALLTGAALMYAVLALRWPAGGPLGSPAPSLIMLLLVALALKLLYWFENGGLRVGIDGLPQAAALAVRLRVLALMAGLPLPIACALLWWPQLDSPAVWGALVASLLVGSTLEQRLLLQEAATGTPVPAAHAAST